MLFVRFLNDPYNLLKKNQHVELLLPLQFEKDSICGCELVFFHALFSELLALFIP